MTVLIKSKLVEMNMINAKVKGCNRRTHRSKYMLLCVPANQWKCTSKAISDYRTKGDQCEKTLRACLTELRK